MLTRDKILKIDIVTSDNTRILSATGKQISIQQMDNGTYNEKPDVMLITKGVGLPLIERNSAVFTIAYMRNGKRIKYPSFASMSTDKQLNLMVKAELGKILQERRRYFKIEVNIPCVINTVERDDNKTVLSAPYLTQIRDINIGGIFLCMCSGEELMEHDKLMLTISFNGKALDMEAEVLRVQRNASGDIDGYGCRFINIPASYEEIISMYVMEVQRERLKQEMENE